MVLRVKAERLRRRWTQTQLGARAGLSASEISKIETGRAQPYPRQLQRLARALKTNAGELLSRVRQPEV
jgi:transcriptional regulator with XRE-family HTH domain